MDEQKDPMVLWVGKWTPEDVIDRETQLLVRRDSAERPGDQAVESDPRNQ